MPAYARKHQLANSLVYHIFNRSNARIPIFKVERDFRHFIQLLKGYIYTFEIKLYHWVIMSNHYHLLLEIENPDKISKFMAGLNRAYTHYYHKTYLSSGLLWQGRFKLQPVQKERYLIACGRYIERNPVKAGIVLEAADYSYSSANFYCSGMPDGITTENPAFIELGKEITQRQIAYRGFLRNFDTEEEASFANFDQPQGDKEFIKRLIKEHGHYVPRRRGRPIKRIVA
ncbi:MAG: transposase [Candidatus Omnitrophota bacterium]